MQNDDIPSAHQAQSLVSKIKLLYKTSMTSFLHHIDNRKFEEESEVDVYHTRQQKFENIQFPQLQKWKVKK